MDDQIQEIRPNRNKQSSMIGETEKLSRDHRDKVTLARMGKKQVLKRNFGFLSLVSFCSVILGTWEGVIDLFEVGYANGGPVGLIGQFILSWGGTLSMYTVIGELASMAPVAGGQYHWIAMLAPRRIRNFASYMIGWMTCLAWTAGGAGTAFLVATIIQAICAINYPDYEQMQQPYQAALITWAVMLLCVVINTVVASLLPAIEGAFFILHVLGFFGILIPLTYYAPKGTASEIFSATASHMDLGGWPTYGLSFMVGTLGTAYTFVGADAAVHMAEEISNAAVNVPRSIVASVIINGVFGFGMLWAILFCLGTPGDSVDAELSVGFPFIEIFLNATQSIGGATVMTSIVIATVVAGAIGYIATSSRLIWSFARDKGLPFSGTLSKVHTRAKIPVAAVLVSFAVPCLLSLIRIGSLLAFDQVLSLALTSFYTTYFFSCALLLWRRTCGTIHHAEHTTLPNPVFKDETTDEYVLAWGPWHVPGIWGVINNVIAVCYVCTIWLFGFFPAVTPVDPGTMNWSSALFGVTILYSVLYYLIWGRRTYTGPIVEIVT